MRIFCGLLRFANHHWGLTCFWLRARHCGLLVQCDGHAVWVSADALNQTDREAGAPSPVGEKTPPRKRLVTSTSPFIKRCTLQPQREGAPSGHVQTTAAATAAHRTRTDKTPYAARVRKDTIIPPELVPHRGLGDYLRRATHHHVRDMHNNVPFIIGHHSEAVRDCGHAFVRTPGVLPLRPIGLEEHTAFT